MWGFIFKAVLYVGSIAYQYFTKPDIKKEGKPKPGQDTSNFPRANEGDGISVVFGYAFIEDPQVVWHKLLDVINNSLPSFGFYMYTYLATLQEVICHSGIDSLEFIFIDHNANRCDWDGNTTTPDYYGWSSNSTAIIRKNYTAIGTDQYDYDNGGGPIASAIIEFGGASQTPNSYLETASEQGTTIPAYRGVTQVIWAARLLNTVAGSTGIQPAPETPAPCQYLVKRILTQHDGTAQWYSAKAHTGYGLNVIHCIRELIISEAIGAGLDDSFIDSVSFEAAADTCYTEGVGLSFHYNNTDGTVKDIIEELERYMSGICYFDNADELFKIKLFRFDYVYASLDTLTESDYISVTNISRKDASEVVNSVTITYKDRFNFKLKSVNWKDEASIAEIGINPENIDMSWTMNPAWAAKLASEIGISSIAQLHVMQINGPITLDDYNKGDVFKVTSARHGISAVVFRVIDKKRSEIESENVTLFVVEDFYGIGQGAFGIEDNEPDYPALIDVAEPYVDELPYFLNRVIYDDPDTAVGEAITHGFIMAANPLNFTSYGILYKISTDSAYTQYGSGNVFTDIRTLKTAIGMTDYEVETDEGTIPGEESTDPAFTSWIVIDGEIMRVYSNDQTNGKFLVNRGMHDTIPAAHSIGAIIYCLPKASPESRYEVLRASLIVGSTYNVKLTSENITGSQNPAEAEVNNLIALNRSIRPYNAGKVEVNGYSYEDDGIIWIGETDGTPITWEHRNKSTQFDQWYTQTASGITKPFGLLYRLQIFDITGTTIKRTVNLLDDDEYDYTTTLENTDFGSLDDKLIKLLSKQLKDTISFTYTNTNSASSIVASTGTIIWKGADLTRTVQVGYRITLANFANAGNNDSFDVASISYASSDTTITVTDNTGMVDETLSGLDETLSTPDYWDSWQEWSLQVKRLTAPDIVFEGPSIGDTNITIQNNGEYIADGWYYEYTFDTQPATPAEPSDPTISSSFGSGTTYHFTVSGLDKNVWVKARAYKNGVLSPVCSQKNY